MDPGLKDKIAFVAGASRELGLAAPLGLVHRLHLPAADRAGARPAVVLLHGWTGAEHSMRIFWRALPPGVVAVCPRGPLAAEPEGYGWVDRRAPEGQTHTAGLATLEEFVRRLPDAYPVDPARVVLVGFSQGAAISLALALKAPELVAGVAALSGYLPAWARAWATPGRLAGKPVFIAHGTQDTVVPLAEAVAARTALAEAGAALTYGAYPIGHKVNFAGMQALTLWLAAYG